VIISTDRSFAGILNIPHLEVIINVTPVTSEAHIKQIAGRLRKEKDKRRIFIQLGDLSFKKARNMMYRERKVMEEVSISMDRITVGKPQKEVSEEDD
jgi:ERCC4-related helicase